MQKAWITLGDDRWLFDEESWTLVEWRKIKQATGLARIPFLNGLLDEDPDALAALAWFLRTQNGEPDLLPAAVDFRPSEMGWEAFEEPDAVPPSEGADVVPLTTSTSAPATTATTSPAGSVSTPVGWTP